MEITKSVIKDIASMVFKAKDTLNNQTWAYLTENLALCKYKNIDVEGAILFLNKRPISYLTKEKLEEGQNAIHETIFNNISFRVKKEFEQITSLALTQFFKDGEFEADGIRVYKSQMAMVDIWNYCIESDGEVKVILPIIPAAEDQSRNNLCAALARVLMERFESGRTSCFLAEWDPVASVSPLNN